MVKKARKATAEEEESTACMRQKRENTKEGELLSLLMEGDFPEKGMHCNLRVLNTPRFQLSTTVFTYVDIHQNALIDFYQCLMGSIVSLSEQINCRSDFLNELRPTNEVPLHSNKTIYFRKN